MKRWMSPVLALLMVAFGASYQLRHTYAAQAAVTVTSSGSPSPDLGGTTVPGVAVECNSGNIGLSFDQQIGLLGLRWKCTPDSSSMYSWKIMGSGTPQMRLASIAIKAGQPLISTRGTGWVDNVSPSTGSGGSAGIALTDAAPGELTPVLMQGAALCGFGTALPVIDHSSIVGAGMCVDDARGKSTIPNTIGFFGKVLAITNPDGSPLACPTWSLYCAWVNITAPGDTGGLVVAASLDAATVPAYIQANQTAQVSADWTASSGVTQILNKPTLSGGTITGVTTTSPLAGSGTSGSVALSCPTCVTATTQSVTYYATSGAVLSGIKRIPFTVASAANGTWSVSYSAVGCTTLRTWNVSVISPTGTLATQQYVPYVQVANTTTMSGTVYSGAVLALLGATIIPITASANITGEIVCQ